MYFTYSETFRGVCCLEDEELSNDAVREHVDH